MSGILANLSRNIRIRSGFNNTPNRPNLPHTTNSTKPGSKDEPPAKNEQPQAKTEDARKRPQRIGFIEGEFTIPDDFDEMGREESERLFYDSE